MPLPGGPSDKYGNRYEGLWTVHCMLRVLKGEYKSIYLEVPGQDDAEFQTIVADGTCEFHQVKRQNGTEGRWRISELKSKGVLDTFWKCTKDTSQRFVFISMESVQELRELIERASKATDWGNFSDNFLKTSTKLQNAFNKLRDYFDPATSEEVYLRLKYLVLESISEDQLREKVEWGIGEFINGNRKNAVDILAQYALDQVHVLLTREAIIEHLQERGVLAIKALILKERNLYHLPEKPDPFISRTSILRTLTLRFSSETKIVLVKGIDGSGKTTLLTQFIEENRDDSFYFLIGREWTSKTAAFMRDICHQFQNELQTDTQVDLLNYDQLRDLFSRLARDIARLGRQRRKPYYLVIDGLENAKEEPGRESITDLIQLDFEGLFILGSTSRDLPLIRLSHFVENVDYFTHADTEKYLRALGVPQDQVDYIYQISEGLPAYLEQLRREIKAAKPISQVLHNLPSTLRDLLERHWEARLHIEDELILLAMLAHADISFDADTLSRITGMNKPRIKQILDETQFVELNSITQCYRFITEAHHRFVGTQLENRAGKVNDDLIHYYQQDLFTEESLEQLPLLLYTNKKEYEILKNLVNVDYLSKSLSVMHDMSLLRRNVQLMLDTANQFGETKDLSIVSKFSLISSVLKTFSEEAADKFEVQALLAIGKFQESMDLAYKALLVEDRLELLAVIAKALRQNNSSLLENVVQELEYMISNLTVSLTVKERAIDIAADLFVIDAQTALDLLEKVADTDGKYSIDTLLAVLALRLEQDKQAIPNTLKARITDEKLRSFVTSGTQQTSNLTAAEVILEAEQLEDISGQIFLLRSWCNEHRDSVDAIQVVTKAIRIIQAAPREDYSPSMLHLRQFAEPLKQYNYDQIEAIIEIFYDMKAASLQQPYEEAIRLEIILLILEGKKSKSRMHEKLLNLYLDLENLSDLDVLCYCYVQVLLNLEKIDPDDELNLTGELTEKLPEKFKQLLLGSSDHFKVCKRILRALTKYDHELAFDFAKQLNTASRRDHAYTVIMRGFITKLDRLVDPSFLNEVLDELCDPEHRNQTLVLMVSVCSEKFDIQNSPGVEKLLERLSYIDDPIDLAFGYCYAFNWSVKSDFRSESEIYFEKMKNSWATIELLPLRVNVGFHLVITLAEQDVEKAREFYQTVSKDQKSHPLSNSTLAELSTNLLNLSIRSVVAFKDRKDFEVRLDEIISNIDQIPAPTFRARSYGDLSLRFYLQGYTQISNDIFEKKILPLLNNCENKTNRNEFFIYVAPIMFVIARSMFNQYIVELSYERDEVIQRVIKVLVSRHSFSDPINLEENNFTLDDKGALEICDLIEILSSDIEIYSSIKLLINSSIYEAYRNHNKEEVCHLNDRSALSIARRLAEVIANKLPDSQNIQHEGYKILCNALLARFRDVTKRIRTRLNEFIPEWRDIITQARQIPNISDRIFVILSISKMLKSTNKALAELLASEAEELTYTIPTIIERTDHLTEVAEVWHKLGNEQNSQFLLRQAMSIIDGLKWDETKDQVAGQILQAAHAVNPELASSLTSTIDNPLIQHRLQGKVYSEELAREPHKLSSNNYIDDYEPIISAAHSIVQAMNSGKYYTLNDTSIAQWVTVGSGVPFVTSFPIRVLEIQNYYTIGKQNTLRSRQLTEIYANLLESLNLIGRISSELYPDEFSDFRSSKIPQSLQTIPIETSEHFNEFITAWLGKQYDIDVLEIYDFDFSYHDLNLIAECGKTASVKIFTSWRSQELSVRDTTVDALFENAWFRIYEDSPYDLQISLIETENGLCPIESRVYILNKRKGLEIISKRSYLEQAYLYIHELTLEEVNKYSEEYEQLLSNRFYKNEKVVRKIIHID